MSKFTFQIVVEAPPHTSKTCKEELDADQFDPAYGTDCHARELLGRLFQDAELNRLQATCRMVDSPNFDEHKKTNDERIAAYNKILQSITLVKHDE